MVAPTLLEWLRRLAGSFRRGRRDEDLQEELRLHLELATEAEGARGARRAGGVAQAMDRLRDQRGVALIDELRADLAFGWRQLTRHRAASLSAILSLGLAMGGMMAAFRLVDAVLLRPLPVADPANLFVVTSTYRSVDDQPEVRDDSDYPTYVRYVDAVGDRASLLVIGSAARQQIAFAAQEPEPVVGQLLSGSAFATLGLQPALGRLLSPADDAKPGATAVAVVAYDYWTRRMGGDPSVIGRTFGSSFGTLEIVGVAPKGFTGTEPGLVTDVFMPAKLNAAALSSPGWSWFKIWLRPRAGVDPREVQSLLQASFRADHLERVKRFPADTPQSRIDAYLNEQLLLQPAGAGVSALQKSFRRPLWIVASLAALLVLIACANVANLLLARSMTRRVELALRVSIGASRRRLVQLMLVESALLALAASAIGVLFATWAAPLIVSMLAPSERPVRLVLDLDWRTLAAGVIITLSATMLLGVLPALRASSVRPVGALKDTRAGHGHRRITDAIVAGQMALCVFLLFGAALFVGTLNRLQQKPLGFDAGGVMHAVVEARQPLDGAAWQRIADSVRALPQIESVALAGWAPLTGNRWRSSVTVAGTPSPSDAPNWVNVGPDYFATMRTRLVEGREFVAHDVPPQKNRDRIVPGVAIVNHAFARAYFGGASPIGRRVIVDASAAPMEIVGMAEDAVYFNVRETMHPAVFIPFGARNSATLLVRAGMADLRATLARQIAGVLPGARVREVEPLDAYVTQQMVRERLLATLSTFFASLALVLSAIGLYGILNYAVTRERRQIGLRMALGATAGHLVSLITTRVVVLLCVGAAVGLVNGFVLGRACEALLFQIAPTDGVAIAPPMLALVAAALLAAFPPAFRAVRVDPVAALKIED